MWRHVGTPLWSCSSTSADYGNSHLSCFLTHKYTEYQPVFTTRNKWTIGKYVMEVLRRFRYWTLWISNSHSVTLHHIITVFHDIFDHMAIVMRSVNKKITQLKEDRFFTVKLARQKLWKYCTDETPTTGSNLSSAPLLDPFRKLRSCIKWYEGLDSNPEDQTSYTK